MTSPAQTRPVLSDARAMIEALGGSRKAAADLGYAGKNARIMVNQWKARGVPQSWRPKMASLLDAAGYDVSPDFLAQIRSLADALPEQHR